MNTAAVLSALRSVRSSVTETTQVKAIRAASGLGKAAFDAAALALHASSTIELRRLDVYQVSKIPAEERADRLVFVPDGGPVSRRGVESGSYYYGAWECSAV
jgi:hypothetical protein